MKLFIDTADIDEIRRVASWGVLDGVTTNPSLYSKVAGRSYDDVLKEICGITDGPVSAEVIADDADGMVKEGRHFAKIADNIVVKVPMTEEGLKAISRFAAEDIQTNCTLIFTANQGLLAAKAGASFLSPFVGRYDDINEDGMIVVRELAAIIEMYDLDAEIISASIRHPAPRDRVGPGRGAHRDLPVQGARADDPSPADGHRHRPLQGRLGEGARRGHRPQGELT